MKKILYPVFLLTMLILTSCKNTSENMLPAVKGAANTVIVVITGPKWEGAPGETIRSFITEPVIGLPQEEPKFDYLFVPPANFDKVYRRQRNILITKIGSDYKERVVVQRDTWAKSQLVITVMAPSIEAFIDLYKKKGEEINQIISDTELQRLSNSYKAGREKTIVNKLKTKHQVNLDLPIGYKVITDSSNFVWLQNEYRDIIEGIFIYYYPYEDENTFTTDYLLQKRNSFLKNYVPGEVLGSHMTTELRFAPDVFEYNTNNIYTKEIRGLWKMKGGLAMGGPFVSITQYDEAKKRIVTVEGFVFAPSHKKRNLVHRVNAIVNSLSFEEAPE